jgi:hypothetical protein
MTAVDLLMQATQRVCLEEGEPWPEGSEAEFQDEHVIRMAEVFAELVLDQHAAELEREAALMRARMERLQAERAEMVEALKLADGLLSGANMNAAVVERKVRAAIAKAEGGEA